MAYGGGWGWGVGGWGLSAGWLRVGVEFRVGTSANTLHRHARVAGREGVLGGIPCELGEERRRGGSEKGVNFARGACRVMRWVQVVVHFSKDSEGITED